VAAAEFGIMAGADRVEGTLFGNGERTGNLDLVNVAVNLFTQGVDPELDLSDIDEMRRVVEFSNRLPIGPRHPWVGDLVYTSFSGSHQDAIKKGMAAIYHAEEGGRLTGDYKVWDVPYLPIDPKHLGRSYEAVIRVNSQSGKGGVAYVLLHEYGLDLPRALQVAFSQRIQAVTEESGTEITSYEIYRRFMARYVESADPMVELLSHKTRTTSDEDRGAKVTAHLLVKGSEVTVKGEGNGPIDAFVHALRDAGLFEGKLVDYVEHAVGTGSDTSAAAYVEIDTGDRDTVWGVGLHASILTASFRAVVSAVNGLVDKGVMET
jgi:2-isopropylmalate synthase